MTREEAIRMLSNRDAHGVPCGYTSGYQEAFDMAVEALKELPKRRKEAKRWKRKALKQDYCKEVVNRKEIQQKINRLWNSNGDKDYCMESLRDFVAELPPAQPERKKGKWIYGNGNGECPICGHERQLGWDNFCGFCGADMRGERSRTSIRKVLQKLWSKDERR